MTIHEKKRKLAELKIFLKESEDFVLQTLKELGLTRTELNLINSIPSQNRYLN